MRIVKLNVLMDKEKVPMLVKEKAVLYENVRQIASGEDVAQIMTDVFLMDRSITEEIYLIAINNRGKPIGFFQLNKGCIDNCTMDVRGMMVMLLLCNASSFIIVHNHVSGEIIPSSDDFDVTERVKLVAEIMGIHFLDHIIIGAGYEYFSFHENIWSKENGRT